MKKEKIGLWTAYLSMVLFFITLPGIGTWAMLFPLIVLSIYFILPHRSWLLPHPKHVVIMLAGGGLLLAVAIWAMNLTGSRYLPYLPMLFILTYQVVLQTHQINRIEQDADGNSVKPLGDERTP